MTHFIQLMMYPSNRVCDALRVKSEASAAWCGC
jgi:hypothetical protein